MSGITCGVYECLEINLILFYVLFYTFNVVFQAISPSQPSNPAVSMGGVTCGAVGGTSASTQPVPGGASNTCVVPGNTQPPPLQAQKKQKSCDTLDQNAMATARMPKNNHLTQTHTAEMVCENHGSLVLIAIGLLVLRIYCTIIKIRHYLHMLTQ